MTTILNNISKREKENICRDFRRGIWLSVCRLHIEVREISFDAEVS